MSRVDPAPIAAVRSVSVRHGDVVALHDVTVLIDPGERVGLLGPSGSGKTTLLDLLGGRLEPTEGEVAVFGRPPAFELRNTGRRRRAYGRRIAVVRQHGDLALPLRVVHNVNAGRLGHWSSFRAAASLLRPLERDAAATALTAVGLERRIDAVTGDLSGGERQRVAIARALRQEPDLLLADEPTSSLDPELSDQIMRSLTRPTATSPVTTVVAAHDPDLARRHLDRLIGLRTGSVAFDHPADEVTDDMLRDLYDRGARPA